MEDGSARDAEVDAAPLAPACPVPPRTPCFDAHEVGTTTVPGAQALSLYGMGVRDAGGQVLAAEETSVGENAALVSFSRSAVSEPVSIDSDRTHYAQRFAVATSAGVLRVGWRYWVRRSFSGPVEAIETATLTVAPDGTLSAPQVVEHVDGESGDLGADIALSIIAPDAAWLALAGRDGLEMRRTDRPREIPVMAATASTVQLTPFARGVGILWEHPLPRERRALHLADVGADGTVIQDVVLTEIDPSPAAVLGVGDGIYVAAFERDDAELRQSRIRVFHLDADLGRLEPDRTYVGWGGLSPSGLVLVILGGKPWLVWQTIDARAGPHDVVFAYPLDGEACAATVGVPVTVLSGPATLAPHAFSATSDGTTLWIARAEGDGAVDMPPSLHVYTAALCEDTP